MTDERPDISIVIPVFNEEPNLRELYTRTVAALEKLGRSFEIVAVDDGSRDGSVELLRELHAGDPRLRLVRLSRNFGQTPALYAGFAHARGEVLVTIDADLQNPPEEIHKVVEKLEEGFDVVQGWRENRQDSLFRRVASKILNALISHLINVRIRDLGCGLKAFRREVVERMAHFSHHSRYVPAEVVWLGVRIGEVKVEHNERAGGDSKYSLFALLRLNFDMIASVTSMPLKFIGWMGWLFSLVGFGMAVRILFMRLRYGNYDNLASVVAIFFFLAGIQMIASGIMCEYVSRIFVEVQDKPYYVVKEVIE